VSIHPSTYFCHDCSSLLIICQHQCASVSLFVDFHTNAHWFYHNSTDTHHALCVSELMQFMDSTYASTDGAMIHLLSTVWDWKSWLSSHSHSISGHVFHFCCNSTGAPVIQDKAYHTAGAWSQPYQLLASNPTGSSSPLFIYYVCFVLKLSFPIQRCSIHFATRTGPTRGHH
jgi:hypothetical protein